MLLCTITCVISVLKLLHGLASNFVSMFLVCNPTIVKIKLPPPFLMQ